MLKQVEKDNPIKKGYYEIFVYRSLSLSTKTVWSVKKSTQLEKPGFVITGFQTNRDNNREANASHFDRCKIANLMA